MNRLPVYTLAAKLKFWEEVVKQRVAKLAGVSRVRIDKEIAELASGEVMEEAGLMY